MERDERPVTGRDHRGGIVAQRRRDGGSHRRYAWSPFEAIEALLYLGVGLVKVLVRGILDH